jgi:hypothetical protein
MHGRLRLYNILDKLGDKSIYSDTDSVVYLEDDETEKMMQEFIGNSLGQLTDECKGGYINYFAAMAPKDYGYILINQDGTSTFKSKVKGFKDDAEFENKMTIANREKFNKQTNKSYSKKSN